MDGQMSKQLGIDLVTEHNPDFVALARARAVELCRMNGAVSVDALREWARRTGVKPKHPNAWGAVFRSSQFRRVGFMPSSTPSAHARVVSVWELSREAA